LLSLLICRQVLVLPAIALAQAGRAGLPARALTPICFFNYALNTPNNLFFPYILRSRMAGMITHVPKFSFRYVLLMHRNVELAQDMGTRPLEHMYQRLRPARRPPDLLRAGMAGGFSVNPEPLNP